MSDDAIKGIQRFFGRVKDFFSTQIPEKPDAPRWDVRAVPAFYADKTATLKFVRETPLVYGYWGDFKRIFKQAETEGDRELLAALLARLDAAPFPVDRQTIPTPLDALGPITGIAANANGLYVTGGDSVSKMALRTVDASNLAAPIGTHKIEIASLSDATASDRYVCALQPGAHYGANRDWTVHCHALSEVSASTNAVVPAVGSSGAVAISENTILAIMGYNQQTALNVFQLTAPDTLTNVAKLDIESAVSIVAQGNFAFVISQASYRSNASVLRVVDISEPAKPRIITTADIFHPTGIAMVGDKIYVTSGQRYYGVRNNTDASGLTIFEWRNNTLRKIGALTMANAKCVVVSGNVAYVGMDLTDWSEKSSGGIRIVDVSDPTAPREISAYAGAGIRRIVLRGSALFAITDRGPFDSTKVLRAFDVSNPAKIYLIGTPASKETLAYMKRRARRILREVAKQEPDAYAAFAAEILAQSGQKRDAVNFDIDWLTVPILLGGGKRYAQTQHDRGRFVCRVTAFVRTRREESYPELWDKNPQIAEPLYTNAELPKETREFALRLLRFHALPLPDLNAAALMKSLTSGAALLVSQGVRQIVATVNSGENVLPELAAEAFFRGSGMARRSLLTFLNKTANDQKRNETFAAQLYALASANIGDVLTRKQQAAFVLLAERFTPLVRSQVNAQLTVKMYATGRADFANFAEDIFAHMTTKDLLNWLVALNTLDEAKRDKAFSLIRANIGGQSFNDETAKNLVYSPETWVRESGWILLAESAASTGVFEKLWNELLNVRDDVTALATAFASPAALSMIPRITFNYAQLLNVLRSRPQLLEWITPQIFALLLPSLALDSLLELIGLIPDAQWINIRPAAVSGLQKFDRGLAFWGKVFDMVNAAGATPLSRRLFDDPDLSETFVNLLDIGDLLKSANPAFGPLLGRWVAAHSNSFERDSAALLAIATSMQPEIRTVGLAKVNLVGLSVPFALRLLELELPDAIEAGKAFFGKATQAQEMEYAVALCDSPQNSVREYGLQYTQARLSELDRAALFARLSENPNLKVQIWVAKELRTADSPGASDFDRAVLRQRDKGRKAKEAVKKQIAKEPAPDVNLLLELARSRTPRDAEWALQELAKLALSGVEIPGVALDGAAGG